MEWIRYIKLFFAAGFAMFCCSPAPQPAFAAAQQEIIINGSTTVLPVMQMAGEAFMAEHPDISLAILGGGSGNGIKALTEGLCRVAMSSRDAKPSELQQAAAKGVVLYRTAVAVDAVAPVVHPDNPVRDISLARLRDIFSGRSKNWETVGGADSAVVPVSRDTSSGTYEMWEELVMEKERITPAALLQASNGAVAQTVAKNRKAIGYVGLAYIHASLRPLSIDGVPVSRETVLDGRWPVARELYIFTDKEPAGAVKQLVDFLLDPEKGQKAVMEAGYVPLPLGAR